ncbi:rhomboid family intramembrane serine protease [Alphaproteobacteria bacterium LSUCC0684]
MFFLPLFDDNPTSRPPLVTWMIMALCILIFLIQATQPERGQYEILLRYATIPAIVTGEAFLPDALRSIPSWATLVSSTFLHGGWMHLGGNMLYLWIFADNVEDRMGPVRFLLFYLICGVAASLAHVMVDPASTTPLVGASGAIAGVLAAYLLMFPRAKVRVIMVILIFIRWIYIPAFVVLGVWVLLQFVAAPSSLAGDGGGTAYFAHIGGFLAGLVLTPFFKKKGVVLLPKQDEPPHWDISPAPARQVRDEFRKRYSYRRPGRSDIPSISRKNSRRKGPWG